MKAQEILRQVDKLPLSFDNGDNANMDPRWPLSKGDPGTKYLNKRIVRRRMSDIYYALTFNPYLMRFAQFDKFGHIRVGPFPVHHKGGRHYLYLTFAKKAPLISVFFMEISPAARQIQTPVSQNAV